MIKWFVNKNQTCLGNSKFIVHVALMVQLQYLRRIYSIDKKRERYKSLTNFKDTTNFHLTLYICTIVSVQVVPSDSTTE